MVLMILPLTSLPIGEYTAQANSVSRWNPCKTIHYMVDPTNAPREWLPDINAAFHDASIYTGIKVKYDGVWPHNRQHQDDGDPVLISFRSEPGFTKLGYTEPAIRNGKIVGGTILINPIIKNYYPNVYKRIIYHEVGHIFGLPHSQPKYNYVSVMGYAWAPYKPVDIFMFKIVGKQPGECRR